jgi:hypothetical protein
MDGQVTNPTGEAAANPSQVEAGAPAPSGSQYRTGMLVSVPHPGIPDDEDQPGGQQAGATTPTAQRSARGPNRPGPARPHQEPPRANLEDGGAGEDPGDTGQPADSGQEPAPYKVLDYKGRQVPVRDEAELLRLAQQGFDYTVKTQMLAPHLADLRAIAALKADPARAAQLQALLSGQALPTGDGAPSQAGPAAPKLPVIYVRDPQGNILRGEDGQPVKADPTFVHAIKDYVDALGLESKAGPATLTPELAAITTQVQVGKVSAYVKETYGREDFSSAIPLIQEAMVAQGITAGDPRDNPTTWLSIYNHLALTNGLPAPGRPAPGAAPDPGQQPSSKRANKSDIKAAAQTPARDNSPRPKQDFDQAIKRAKENGTLANWTQAVGLVISHPGLEE